uniref:Uncharacterized protein n=1 Tax=Rat stool-associated circular ssDNA virus TaxID=1699316 RepID=A0A0S2LUM7_9VIRU|nr:hypothetical protein [Rat stool-associated circular ssDNA virus]ALO65154.1 hypothetical protein [Rat stool-associated circular ssDNA virus]ALO65155.1 hypothetical protein [Rat stool-associated circular ssDNA virus]
MLCELTTPCLITDNTKPSPLGDVQGGKERSEATRGPPPRRCGIPQGSTLKREYYLSQVVLPLVTVVTCDSRGCVTPKNRGLRSSSKRVTARLVLPLGHCNA